MKPNENDFFADPQQNTRRRLPRLAAIALTACFAMLLILFTQAHAAQGQAALPDARIDAGMDAGFDTSYPLLTVATPAAPTGEPVAAMQPGAIEPDHNELAFAASMPFQTVIEAPAGQPLAGLAQARPNAFADRDITLGALLIAFAGMILMTTRLLHSALGTGEASPERNNNA